MGLGLYYKEDDEFVAITKDSDTTNPHTSTHNGRTGDVQTFQIYLRNDDAAKWFSNIRIKPLDLVDPEPYGDIAYIETGWGIKLSAEESEPSSSEWEDIDWGNTISMSNVGSDAAYDIATYFPFWYLITCPPNTDATTKTDIVLNVSYTENAVT